MSEHFNDAAIYFNYQFYDHFTHLNIVSVPYYPRSNPIEQFFSQLKHYIKKDSPISYEDIKTSIGKAMMKVKEKHLNNYFLHAFNLEMLKKDRATRRRKPKVYID